jgi:hypothetical protein
VHPRVSIARFPFPTIGLPSARRCPGDTPDRGGREMTMRTRKQDGRDEDGKAIEISNGVR